MLQTNVNHQKTQLLQRIHIQTLIALHREAVKVYTLFLQTSATKIKMAK